MLGPTVWDQGVAEVRRVLSRLGPWRENGPNVPDGASLTCVRTLTITVGGVPQAAVTDCTETLPAPTPKLVNISVGDFYFCDPSFSGSVCETNISVGNTVTWQWVGAATHTVTECDDTFTTCPPAGGFDSGTLGNGATFSHTFNAAGSFEYRCNIHTTQMRGRINVAP
jgi:hypothetical protein